MIKEIINDLEKFGDCFIGTVDVQGMTAVRRFKKVKKAFEKRYPDRTVAWDAETGICWWI